MRAALSIFSSAAAHETLPSHLTFKGAADGEIFFGLLKGFLDLHFGARADSLPEFS